MKPAWVDISKSLCIALVALASMPSAWPLDLSHAIVVAPAGLSRIEKKAVTLLVEEVEKQSQIRWEVRSDYSGKEVAIVLGQESLLKGIPGLKLDGSNGGAAEGFHLRVNRGGEASSVTIVGNDPRGVLYGAGYLLRQLHMARGHVSVRDELTISTAPRYPLRGHQLGYRPKTHSYDAWYVATWEQYYRDLIVFGANAVELIPPRSDDDADSPHFPLPPMQMMTEMSRLADDYGLDVWIWYPAMDKDYSDATTV